MLRKRMKVKKIRMLGEGTYGRVSRAVYEDKPCAVKINMFHDWTKWGNGIVNLIEYDILKRFSGHPLFLELYAVLNRENEFIRKVEEESMENVYKGEVYDRSDQQLDNIHFILELGKCSLSDLMEEVRLDLDKVTKILCDILLGLEHLHHNGVIHRDLKTGNVIIFEEDEDYIAKICDFGMSKYYTSQDKNCGEVATYSTRSPELVMKDKYGPPSDVWTAGCILYEILFGDTIIDLKEVRNEKGEKVFKFERRRALLSIFKYANHNITLENINRILKDLKEKGTSKIERVSIESRVNEFEDKHFSEVYSKKNLIELLNGLLDFDQEKRLTASQALELPIFNNLKDYIVEVRKYNVKYDIKGIDLKMVKCTMRDFTYNRILAKPDKVSAFTTEERYDIHTIIMMERWIRAMYKAGDNVNKTKEDFEKYYIIVRGVVEKLFSEGNNAPYNYVNRVKQLEKEFGNWFMETEEELVLFILEYPYEITPYEIAHQRGLVVRNNLFKAIVKEMYRCIEDGEIMDMEKVVDNASKIKEEKRIKKPIIKSKTRIPRNRR